MTLEFDVDDKPPKKTVGSLWSENSNQTPLVVNLRQKAFEASQKAGFKHLHGSVKLSLTVYAPNVLERKDRHDYLGDLDALIGGVFEALQPAPTNPDLKVDPALKDVENIGSDIALIVSDDAQITTTVGKKIKRDGKISYTVMIESDNKSVIEKIRTFYKR